MPSTAQYLFWDTPPSICNEIQCPVSTLWDTSPNILHYEIHRPVSIMRYTAQYIHYEIHCSVSSFFIMRYTAHPLLIPDVLSVSVLYYKPTPTTTGRQSCRSNKIPVQESCNWTLSTKTESQMNIALWFYTWVWIFLGETMQTSPYARRK